MLCEIVYVRACVAVVVRVCQVAEKWPVAAVHVCMWWYVCISVVSVWMCTCTRCVHVRGNTSVSVCLSVGNTSASVCLSLSVCPYACLSGIYIDRFYIALFSALE